MMANSDKCDAMSLMPPNGGGRGFEDYEAISHYCVEKVSSFDPVSNGVELTKENTGDNSFGGSHDIQQLAFKAQSLTPKKNVSPKVSVPDRKLVFRDKTNSGGKNSPKKQKKQEGEGKGLRQKLTKSQKRILQLKDEIKQKDATAVKKDRELDDMSVFMTELEDLLHDMASPRNSSQPTQASESNKLQVALKEREKEISSLNERVLQLNKSLKSQESMISSLKNLNNDSAQTVTSLMQLVGEKDQALMDISQFNEMNDCANRALLAHAHEKHKEAMREIGIKYEKEINSLEDKNIQLLDSIASQASLIGSLKSLNIDSEQTISSLTQLIGEKDMALEEMSSFTDMNDHANKNLLIHAHENHQEELREHELRMKNLCSIVSQQLREKRVHQRELALMKHQIEEGSHLNKEYVEEVKFMIATMSMVSVLMALLWQKEWFLYISPLYFLFVFSNLE